MRNRLEPTFVLGGWSRRYCCTGDSIGEFYFRPITSKGKESKRGVISSNMLKQQHYSHSVFRSEKLPQWSNKRSGQGKQDYQKQQMSLLLLWEECSSRLHSFWYRASKLFWVGGNGWTRSSWCCDEAHGKHPDVQVCCVHTQWDAQKMYRLANVLIWSEKKEAIHLLEQMLHKLLSGRATVWLCLKMKYVHT